MKCCKFIKYIHNWLFNVAFETFTWYNQFIFMYRGSALMTNATNTIAKIKMVFGIDIGYHDAKIVFSIGGNKQEDSFLSTVLKGKSNIKTKGIVMGFENNFYTLGSIAGEPTENLNKTEDLDFKLLLLGSILKNMPSDEVEVSFVTGVPAKFYDTQKSKLRNLLENQLFEVLLLKNDKEIRKKIITKGVRIFPQCSGLFIKYPELLEGSWVVTDWGGKTMDIVCYEDGEIVAQYTHPLGSLDLYKSIKDEFESNPDFSVPLRKMSCENIVRNKSMILDGQDEDVSAVVNPIIKDFAENGLNYLLDNVPQYRTSKRMFIGGTSIIVKDNLPKNHKLVENTFFNADIFHDIALEKFGK